MGHRFAMLTFTPTVTAAQTELGSAGGYATWSHGSDADSHHSLTEQARAFITARDSFYMASVSETGWPYVQHRGGAPGFVRVMDERTLGFADFSGNRQYVSLGNLRHDPRVSLFFMDYPNRARLKVLGRVEFIAGSDFAALARLEVEGYRATVERGIIIHVDAFDWNCSQHITPRYSERERPERFAALEPATLPALGSGPLAVEVVGVRRLTPDIRTYELRRPDGLPLPPFEAGAHLQIPVTLPAQAQAVRPFSLCSDPADVRVYTIAVQRQDSGRGGTLALHRSFAVGTCLQLEPPVQAFSLHSDDRPAVLIAGGIGITPLRAMVHTLVQEERSVVLHYAGRSRARMAFIDALERQLGPRLRVYASDEGHRLDVEETLRHAPAESVFYVCGPARLADEVLRVGATLGISGDRLRHERFGSSVGAPVELHLRRSRVVLDVRGDQPLLEAILAAGVELPFSCRAGTCRTCAVRVLDGTPEHRDQALTPSEREEGWLCPCVSRAESSTLELDL